MHSIESKYKNNSFDKYKHNMWIWQVIKLSLNFIPTYVAV
jgi:hypothetical protein